MRAGVRVGAHATISDNPLLSANGVAGVRDLASDPEARFEAPCWPVRTVCKQLGKVGGFERRDGEVARRSRMTRSSRTERRHARLFPA